MLVSVSELCGVCLNYAVSVAEGLEPEILHDADGVRLGFTTPDGYIEGLGQVISVEEYDPSHRWSQGGPIIEREKIRLCVSLTNKDWYAELQPYYRRRYGTTPLIAAMRCYVASKLGAEVEVPDELLSL